MYKTDRFYRIVVYIKSASFYSQQKKLYDVFILIFCIIPHIFFLNLIKIWKYKANYVGKTYCTSSVT